MANFCVSGQSQEYLGFVQYLVYQTLYSSVKNTTQVGTVTIENSKDYEINAQHTGVASDVAPGVYSEGRMHSAINRYDISSLAAGSNLATAIATDISNYNKSWGSDLTVDKLVYTVHGITNYGSELYGSPWLKTETETVSTTQYDKVKAAGDKVIHVSWNDTSDSNNHWLRAMARYEAMANAGSVDWDERRKAYARNRLAITYPSGDNDYKLCIDKILDKDDTEYANLCTFLGVSALSSATWKSYVDAYLTAIA